MRPSAPSVSRLQWAVVAGAFALLITVYFMSFGSTAWHPTDYEYVMACAHRIVHGQIPYRDFIYHKPPLTPYLHTIWFLLPEGWQVRASRLFFYVQMALTGFLPIAWSLWRGQVNFGWRLPCLGVIFTLFALHNFPVMPWQTSDGLMFSTVGVVALFESLVQRKARARLIARGLASASFVLGLLCKQSFFVGGSGLAVLAIAELGCAFYRAGRSESSRRDAIHLFLASALPAVLILGAVYTFLWAAGAVDHYLAQFRSQSSGPALVHHGYTLFRTSPHLWTLLPWTLFPLLALLDRQGRGIGFGLARLFAAVGIGFVAKLAFERPGQGFGSMGHMVFFILLGTFLGRGLTLLLSRLRGAQPARPGTDLVNLGLHFACLVLAWSCALSLGYPTPILGVAGLGIAFHVLLPEERNVWADVLPVVLALLIASHSFFRLNQLHPYRDWRRDRLVYDLGRISPKLAGIRTNPGTFARYVELKEIIQEYAKEPGERYAVLQDYPGAHWLFDEPNAIGIDWVYPPEPDGAEQRLWKELIGAGAVAIVPKEKNTPWEGRAPRLPCEGMTYPRHNVLSQWAASRLKLLGGGTYFCVYGR